MTNVSGASIPALEGVCGAVLSAGRSPLLEVVLFEGSVLSDCKLSDAVEPFPKFILLRFMYPDRPLPLSPLPSMLIFDLLGLFGGLLPFLRDPTVNTSLILAPGETPRLLDRSDVLR